MDAIKTIAINKNTEQREKILGIFNELLRFSQENEAGHFL